MLELMKGCSFIVTDSGGIQEEVTSPKIRKKVLVVRKTSDRPEAVEAGFAEVIGTNHKNITFSIKKTAKKPKIKSKKTPYVNCNSSDQIIRKIQRYF